MNRERGSVTMEYVVVLFIVISGVYAIFIEEFYSPIIGFHGLLGDALRGVMQRILEGIAIP